MDYNSETREALRLLEGIENGTLTSSDAFNISEELDPVLVYFIVRYLREKAASLPMGAAINQRLVDLTSSYDAVAKKVRSGERDSMREWFDDAHSMREFFQRPADFVDLIVDKLES